VYDALTNAKRFDFFAFDDSLRGGVSVATGDVTGDGVEDLIVGAGLGGGPVVEVFDGATGALVASFFAYEESARGGVWVSTGDVDGDGVDEVITGPGVGGGPVVEVWRVRGGQPTLIDSFFAFDPALRTGVTVAAVVGPDGSAAIATGAGTGGPPRLRTFDARTHAVLADLDVFEPTFTGGVYVAAGDVLGTGAGDQLLVGPGPGGGPRLRVLGTDGSPLADTFADVDTLRNGLTVAGLERPTGRTSVLVGAGLGAYQGDLTDGSLGVVERVGFFEDSFQGGVFVG
jgi:hypothetical protein